MLIRLTPSSTYGFTREGDKRDYCFGLDPSRIVLMTYAYEGSKEVTIVRLEDKTELIVKESIPEIVDKVNTALRYIYKGI